MNYKTYVNGYLRTRWEFSREDASVFTSAIWAEMRGTLDSMMRSSDAGAFFDWEQVRDSAIRVSRRNTTVKMTPIKLVGVHIFHEMLGIEPYMEVAITCVEPEMPDVKGDTGIVGPNGAKLTAVSVKAMMADSLFWTGPRNSDGEPLMHYDCELHVHAPAEIPLFEPDYDEVIKIVQRERANRQQAAADTGAKTPPSPKPLVVLS